MSVTYPYHSSENPNLHVKQEKKKKEMVQDQGQILALPKVGPLEFIGMDFL